MFNYSLRLALEDAFPELNFEGEFPCSFPFFLCVRLSFSFSFSLSSLSLSLFFSSSFASPFSLFLSVILIILVFTKLEREHRTKWKEISKCKEFFEKYARNKGLNPSDPTTWQTKIEKILLQDKVNMLHTGCYVTFRADTIFF